MSKLEQTLPDYDAYEAFVESERMELRREGAAELQVEIQRVLDTYIAKAWTSQEKAALQTAKVIVDQATI